MNYSADTILNGIMKYADSEIMDKLPTMSKFVFGTAVNLASDRIDNIIGSLMGNPVVNALGIVDEDRNIDVDAVIKAMKASSDRCGKITIEVPLIGKMTFASNDIDLLRNYIG